MANVLRGISPRGQKWGRGLRRVAVLLVLGAVWVSACSRAHPEENKKTAARAAVPPGVVPVQVQKTDWGYRLLRGGQACLVRGGGGVQQLAQLRAAGGNSVRLWSTDYAGPLLDEAQRQGLTVMLGLRLAPEDQHFSYYDPAMVRAQQQRVRQQVLRYRHHPALLMWNVGNELEYSAAGRRVFEAVSAIARMIHELDPYHPVTTSLGNNFVTRAAQLQRIAPEVDILSLNVYGEMRRLPALLHTSGWRGPYMVTEYGCKGYWESNSTSWEAPQEQTSAAKAGFIRAGYQQTIAADTTHCLGSYAFYWGAKFEYTPTWFSLFEPTGEKTESVDELQRLWSRHYPANRAPHLTRLLLAGHTAADNVQLLVGQVYPAEVQVSDPEADSLTTRWEVLPETRPGAGMRELMAPPEPVPGRVVRAAGRQALIRMPDKPGAYRLYVRVFDGHGSVATANVPVLVRRPAGATTFFSALLGGD